MKKLALITGASRGIGLSVSRLFREKGIDVLCPGRDELDLASNVSIQNYFRSFSLPIDMLINNAGINSINLLEETTDDEIEEMIRVNLISPMLLTRSVIKLMIPQKSGKILNISSIWGIVSKPRRSVYASTKSALNGFTRTMALELAPHNILVNAIAPGFVNTELTQKNNSPEELNSIIQSIPLKRMAEPDEIAELAWFLCSENNTFITGQTITIDGGFTCQ